MKRALLLSIAAIGAFGVAAHALASVSGTGIASITVQQAAGINVVSPLVLPTVSTAPVVSTPVSTTAPISSSASAGSTGPALSNAALTIYGDSGDAVSMAVPETFQVVRTGGTESLTVKTNTQMEYDVGGNGVILGGGATSDTMSVNVGGALTLASAEPLVPGPYEGMLVVVVQYN